MAALIWNNDDVAWDNDALTWSDETYGDEPEPGDAVYPEPSQVASGIQYGPNGDDYTGTLVAGGVGFLIVGVNQ